MQLLGAPVTTFSLERKGVIETLGHIDERELPSVAEMPPHKHRQIVGTRDEAFVRLIDQRVLLLLVLITISGGMGTHPLNVSHTLKVAEVVSDDRFFGLSLSAIYYNET